MVPVWGKHVPHLILILLPLKAQVSLPFEKFSQSHSPYMGELGF